MSKQMKVWVQILSIPAFPILAVYWMIKLFTGERETASSRSKGGFGLFVLLGLPVVFGLLLADAAYGYDQQVVSDWSQSSDTSHNNIETITWHNHVFRHSFEGIAAIAGVCGLAWVVLTAICVLIGGTFIANRFDRW